MRSPVDLVGPRVAIDEIHRSARAPRQPRRRSEPAPEPKPEVKEPPKKETPAPKPKRPQRRKYPTASDRRPRDEPSFGRKAGGTIREDRNRESPEDTTDGSG